MWRFIPLLICLWFISIAGLVLCGVLALLGFRTGEMFDWCFAGFCAATILLSPVIVPFAISKSFSKEDSNA